MAILPCLIQGFRHKHREQDKSCCGDAGQKQKRNIEPKMMCDRAGTDLAKRRADTYGGSDNALGKIKTPRAFRKISNDQNRYHAKNDSAYTIKNLNTDQESWMVRERVKQTPEWQYGKADEK